MGRLHYLYCTIYLFIDVFVDCILCFYQYLEILTSDPKYWT